MKKTITLLLCALSAASLAACGQPVRANASNMSSTVQIPSPFVDCDTLDSAAAVSGFHMTVPETVDGYSDRNIQAVEDEMIQVFYQNGEDEICIRKAAGGGDVSGDYNEYAETSIVPVGEIPVSMRGNDGTVHVAVWETNGFAYAIGVNGDGLAADAVSALVSAVK